VRTALTIVTLIAFAHSASAELKDSDEQFYAVFVAALDRCEVALPEAKEDYAKVRYSLDRLAQRNPKLSAALKSPTLESTLAEARIEMDKYLAQTNKKAVCTQLRQGQFGQMGIPLEP
jgi:hypothetical protein